MNEEKILETISKAVALSKYSEYSQETWGSKVERLREEYRQSFMRRLDPMTDTLRAYTIGEKMRERISNDFAYHPPKPGQQERYVFLRDQAHTLALQLCQMCPQSRELSLALTHLEQAIFFANASIARNEKTPVAGQPLGSTAPKPLSPDDTPATPMPKVPAEPAAGTEEDPQEDPQNEPEGA